MMNTPCHSRARGERILGALLLVSAALAGCGSIGTLSPTATGPADDEGILVLGVRPPGYGVMFFPGSGESGRFRPAPARGIATVISDVPHDGYVVARAKAGQVIALMVVNAPKVGGSGGQYHVCGGSRALVVEVPKGRVGYVTDLEFTPDGDKLQIRNSIRVEAARAHIRKNFPHLKGDVELLESHTLPSANECAVNSPGPIVIPIYIGR